MQVQEIDLGDLEPKTALVRFGMRRFVIRELSAADKIKHENVVERHVKRDAEGNWTGTTDDFGEANILLCSLCTFENVGQNGDTSFGRQVTVEEVRGWPDRIRQALVSQIIELCPSLRGLDTIDGLEQQIARLVRRLDALKGKDAAKNAPGATTEPSE